MAFALRRPLVFLIFMGHLRNFADSAGPHLLPPIELPPSGSHHHPPISPGGISVARSFHTEGMDSNAQAHSESASHNTELKGKMTAYLRKHHITNQETLIKSLQAPSTPDSKQ